MPNNFVFKHLAGLMALCSLLACQQMAPGGMSATGTPNDSTEASSKSDEGDPSLPPGVGGGSGLYGAEGAGGSPGGGGSAGGAGDSSDSSSTVAARKIDPVSATADPSMVECPPDMTEAECARMRMSMAVRMGTAISNDPRIDLAVRDGSQFIRIVSWPEETAMRLGLTSEEAVLANLHAGILAPEAVQAATVQDVAVAVRADGSFDLSPFLKSGINLVFADAGGATATPPADLASTVKSERFSYLSYTSHLASEFKAVRLDEVKKLNLNEAR